MSLAPAPPHPSNARRTRHPILEDERGLYRAVRALFEEGAAKGEIDVASMTRRLPGCDRPRARRRPAARTRPRKETP
jgi:hypothetical protein